MIKSKSGAITFIIASVFIAILAFFISLGFVIKSGDVVSGEAEDFSCRSFIEISSVGVIKNTAEALDQVGIGGFTNSLKQKCVTEKVNVDSKSEDELFEEVSNNMARCWYRYGKGENDFLSNYGTTGNWCFLCGEVEYDEDFGGETYEYSDLVSWMQENEYKKEDGESQSYFDYMNLRYYEVNNEELEDIGISIKELMGDEDLLEDGEMPPEYAGLLGVITDQYEVLMDLKLKEINPNEKSYIVYRFNRVDKSLGDELSDATKGVVAGTVGGLVVGAIAENILTGAVTAVGCVFSATGVGAVVCGGGAAIITAKVSKAVNKVYKATAKVTRVMKKITRLNKFSKVKRIDDVIGVGKIDDLVKLSVKVRKSAPDLADNIDDVVRNLDNLGIKNVNEIDLEILDNEEKLEQLYKLYDNSVNHNFLKNDEIMNKFIGKEAAIVDELETLQLIQMEMDDIMEGAKSVGDLTADNKVQLFDRISKGLKGSLVVMGAAAGGATGYNYNSNENQYVDIMTREEYYRQCGTQSYSE